MGKWKVIEYGKSFYGSKMWIAKLDQKDNPINGIYAVLYKSKNGIRIAFRSFSLERVKAAFNSYKKNGVY